MKIGIVFEGGAMRGMYTAGVIDVLLEMGIKADVVIGVSAGALFGINYKSRQKGRALRSNLKYVKDKRYMSLYNLVTTGNIVNEDFCFNEIPNILDDFNYASFKRSKGEFYAVVTNVNSGEAEYIKIEDCKRDVQALRASGSMPFVSRPVEYIGQFYLDGGIADSIPIDKIMSMGLDKVIVVLTRPQGYRKKRTSIAPAKVMYKKYPKFVSAVRYRAKMYNDEKAYILLQEKLGNIFFIRPSEELDITRTDTDPEHLEAVYQIGRRDAEEKLSELLKFLQSATLTGKTHT